MGKRVLLVGADLRNPQLHTYTELAKDVPGLSNYLKDQWFSFYDGIHKGFENFPHHSTYLSGKIPNSAPALLSQKRYGEFIQKAKEEYDYIIVDTAPTMLVTDTLLISKYADATLFVVRAGITDKKLLQFSKELAKNKKLNNMAYVLNAVGKIKKGNYNYGYAYGYDNTGA
jgi:Mrp family chromosome partitioning ATPase